MIYIVRVVPKISLLSYYTEIKIPFILEIFRIRYKYFGVFLKYVHDFMRQKLSI